jgi:hypothetical protein
VDPIVGLDDMEKRKFLTLSGLKLRLLGRPVASSYTDCAIPALSFNVWGLLTSQCLPIRLYAIKVFYSVRPLGRPRCRLEDKIKMDLSKATWA